MSAQKPKFEDFSESIFICKGCDCDVPMVVMLKTPGFCFLCDPNITLEELLKDEPIKTLN